MRPRGLVLFSAAAAIDTEDAPEAQLREAVAVVGAAASSDSSATSPSAGGRRLIELRPAAAHLRATRRSRRSACSRRCTLFDVQTVVVRGQLGGVRACGRRTTARCTRRWRRTATATMYTLTMLGNAGASAVDERQPAPSPARGSSSRRWRGREPAGGAAAEGDGRDAARRLLAVRHVVRRALARQRRGARRGDRAGARADGGVDRAAPRAAAEAALGRAAARRAPVRRHRRRRALPAGGAARALDLLPLRRRRHAVDGARDLHPRVLCRRMGARPPQDRRARRRHRLARRDVRGAHPPRRAVLALGRGVLRLLRRRWLLPHLLRYEGRRCAPATVAPPARRPAHRHRRTADHHHHPRAAAAGRGGNVRCASG